MLPRLPRHAALITLLLAFASRAYAMPVIDQSDATDYRLEKLSDANRDLTSRFGGPEIALLEKLNRADRKHLQRLNRPGRQCDVQQVARRARSQPVPVDVSRRRRDAEVADRR